MRFHRGRSHEPGTVRRNRESKHGKPCHLVTIPSKREQQRVSFLIIVVLRADRVVRARYRHGRVESRVNSRSAVPKSDIEIMCAVGCASSYATIRKQGGKSRTGRKFDEGVETLTLPLTSPTGASTIGFTTSRPPRNYTLQLLHLPDPPPPHIPCRNLEQY